MMKILFNYKDLTTKFNIQCAFRRHLLLQVTFVPCYFDILLHFRFSVVVKRFDLLQLMRYHLVIHLSFDFQFRFLEKE